VEVVVPLMCALRLMQLLTELLLQPVAVVWAVEPVMPVVA
jgi:hypothetical protein